MSEAKERCTLREFKQWQAYAQIEPWGEERGDLRSAIVATVIANANRKRGSRAFKPADFMPKFDAPARQSVSEMATVFKAFAAKHNAALRAAKAKGK